MPSRFVKTSMATCGDIGVSIGTDPITGNVAIYLYERRNGKTFAAQPVDLVFSEVDDEQPIMPTIRMNRVYADPLLEAIAEALDQAGVKTETDAKIQGTLEATKYQL